MRAESTTAASKCWLNSKCVCVCEVFQRIIFFVISMFYAFFWFSTQRTQIAFCCFAVVVCFCSFVGVVYAFAIRYTSVFISRLLCYFHIFLVYRFFLLLRVHTRCSISSVYCENKTLVGIFDIEENALAFKAQLFQAIIERILTKRHNSLLVADIIYHNININSAHQ